MNAVRSVAPTVQLPREILLNVGPLTGIASLALYLGEALESFSKAYVRGIAPEVTWDFSNVVRGRMSMSALTTVLAVAERLRRFTESSQRALLRWDPQIFSFWHDISFFRVAHDFDLFDWQPPSIIGAYPQGRTNPDTEILAFNDIPPPDAGDIEAWKRWKDFVRQEVKSLLLVRCGRLFAPNRPALYGSENLRDQVAITAAELIVNAILHAQAPAFVGLQRSRSGITVAVSDCGRGFLSTMLRRGTNTENSTELSTTQALVAGCLMNQREMGLRRGIDTVLRSDGWVICSSDDSFIRWQKDIWHQLSDLEITEASGCVIPPNIVQRLGPPLSGRNIRGSQAGYYRIWPRALKGSRVSFEIPFGDTRSRYS